MENGSAATNGDRAAVPVVDFSQFLNGSEAAQREIARTIDDAFQIEGFVYLSNHGIDQKRVEECLARSKSFFELPIQDKKKAPHPPGHSHHRGWAPVGMENASQMIFDRDELAKLRSAQPDVKETFDSGNTTDKTQPNIWPPEDVLPGFRAFMESYFKDCAHLVHQILDCLSIALSLPDPHALSKAHSTSPFQLRLTHYPPIPTSLLLDGSRVRIGAHSDFGSITLLFQDSIGGLELQGPAKGADFALVEPRRDCVLVNIGDLLERWSNGRWRSTLHRVRAPPTTGKEERLTPSRYSVPFFAVPNHETVIEALPGCWGEGNPKKYEPVKTVDYFTKRMAAIY